MEKLKEKIMEDGKILNEIKNTDENKFKKYIEILKECYKQKDDKEGE
ncbi:TPA: hypothetical protein KNR57_000720 [Clostridioides difficile]|nr:hypothetical protein [Clostridioides difficile]MBY2443967.1 hypothetical protein [Clostridioides difficile]MCV2272461.1 hypothetical protein [Clostridioides difficile]MDV9708987.1 hypothetical protein [Clostridioides difficile]UUV13067.1 hypothetical protein NQ183_10765 [Clostridioides difficile]WOW16844.1 hypothetical protein RHN74_11885 [Clostridioides difficile]